MTTTVLELLANLKHYSDNTVVVIRDVNDTEFAMPTAGEAIVDFSFSENVLTIAIGLKADDEEEEQPQINS